ncbi:MULTISPECIES: hypothetical protein [unclassified Acinetobacter]|uniref:hypothetical protein n=1 Tax=unclassified Acinetobacter TaxID=196816 RepID=UPI0015D25ACF|nr:MULTISPECIES: hypothetical protein [unclassified Acinetobacter]
MTETKTAVANFAIGELHKELPFDLLFNNAEAEIFFAFVDEYKGDIGLPITHKNGLIAVQVNSGNVSAIYDMLARHVEMYVQPVPCINTLIKSGQFDRDFKDVFGLSESVKQSLKEIS